MKYFFKPPTVLTALLALGISSRAQVQLAAGNLSLQISQKGLLQSVQCLPAKSQYLYADTLAPLLTLVSHGQHVQPTLLQYKKASGIISLSYKPAAVTIDIKVVSHPQYLTLEIVKAGNEKNIEAIIWGPIPTTITQTVGEVIGVVRNDSVAIGMQVLNVKTLGGNYPNNEGSSWARGIAAIPYKWGSSLQAYSINRSIPRHVDAWGGEFKNMPVPPILGETVVGSKIALFGTTASNALNSMEAIALAEKLPYPTLQKTWYKKSALFGKSYLISSFGENEVDEMIGYTKRAGLFSLYHEGPFQSWGHYILDSTAFPHGKAGLKTSVDKAHAAGLHFGVHTLTNFINTNDPYVSPVPDDRLSLTGYAPLTADIDAQQKNIEVASPEYFNQEKNNNLHTIKIGKELIRYKSVTDKPPYTLLDCQRGAFGTTASAHKQGDIAGKLFDHAYKVFFPNLELQREIARNMANLFNETGVDHFDLDGHEGCLASGQGDYATELFAKDMYDQIKHEFIIGTSNSETYFWNIGSYYNWGEPWYGGFKESMQQYRIDNQALFDRNFMPHMLGWYLLSETTTMPEMEWMLARAAGYNAGFAMVARPHALRKNPQTPALLDAIREWELARNGGAFSAAQQKLLQQPANEFHLEKISEGQWQLMMYQASQNFVHEKYERQPGEPTHATWSYTQRGQPQALQFRMTVAGKEGSIKNAKLQVDNYAEIILPFEMKAGETVVCDGSARLNLYDENGKFRNSYSLPAAPPTISNGTHSIIFDCTFSGSTWPNVDMQFRQLVSTDHVALPQ